IGSFQAGRPGPRLLLANGAIRGFAQIRIQLSIGRKITTQNIFSVSHTQTRHHRETLRADSVNHAEVQTLRKIALLFADLILRNTKNLGRGNAMKIRSGVESLDEAFIAREFSENAQFDL